MVQTLKINTMKYVKFLSLILFLGFVVACEDDDDDSSSTPAGENNPTGNYIIANLDGAGYEADFVLGQLDSNSIIIGGLTGSSQYPQMIIGIGKNVPAATYTYPVNVFDTSLVAPSIIYSINDTTTYIFNSGEVVLSVNDTINKRVEGTFSGKLYEFSFSQDADSIIVTNGQFGADYN